MTFRTPVSQVKYVIKDQNSITSLQFPPVFDSYVPQGPITKKDHCPLVLYPSINHVRW